MTWLTGLILLISEPLPGHLNVIEALRLHPQAIVVGDHDMNLPSGRLEFKRCVLAQVIVGWDQGTDLVVGYVPVSGEVRVVLRFDRAQDGRVADHNLNAVELHARSQLDVVSKNGIVKEIAYRGKGLLFSSLDIHGRVAPLPSALRPRAQKVIDGFMQQRAKVYYPTETTLDPLLGTLCARLNHKGFLYFDNLCAGQPFGTFVDAYRNVNQGLIFFDSFDGIKKVESIFPVQLAKDRNDPRVNTLAALALEAQIKTSDRQNLTVDAQVTYVDPSGGNRYLYLDLMSDRPPKRLKTRHADGHELSFGGITVQEGPQKSRPFGLESLEEQIHYGRGLEKYAIAVDSVRDAKGRALRFVHANDAVLVELPQPTQAGEPFRLSFSYGGRALALDYGNQLVHFDRLAWWPRPYYYSARPRVDIRYQLQKPWVLIAPGRLSDVDEDGDFNSGRFEDSRRLLNPNIILGHFRRISYQHKGYQVHYYPYVLEKTTVVKKMDTLAAQFIEFYSNLFGLAPFEEISLVEINPLQIPRHPIPGVIALDEQTFNRFSPSYRHQAHPDTDAFRGVNESLAVGIAGLWWSSLVQPGSAYDRWFGYGFPEYSAYLMMDIANRDDAGDKFLKRWNARGDYVDRLPISHAAMLVDYQNAGTDRDLVQYKAARMLEELRRKIGDDQQFVSLLSGFLSKSNFRAPVTADFAQAASSITKSDLTTFFDDQFWGFKR